jgi:hypothetical protein
MKKQTKQHDQVIDLDSFDDVSLYQMIPSGRGFGQALLKCHIDASLNGRAKLNSLLITGKVGLQTHAGAFLRALGIDYYNQIDAEMIQSVFDLHVFLCGEQYGGYIITNSEKMSLDAQKHLYNVLTKQQLIPYNYMEQKHDYYDVTGTVIFTSKNSKKIAAPILGSINHTVELENYTTGQLELVILQRLKYAHIDLENDYVLKNIVRHGNNNLDKSIRFLKCCIAVMQAEGRQKLLKEDVVRGARLNRLPEIDLDFEDTIPF